MKKNHRELYKRIVTILSNFSKDDKVKVGALLLRDGRIISTGFNGQPSGVEHKPIIQESHDVSTIHAEMNCIIHAAKHGISVNDCELFTTHFPCVHCTKLLFQSGVRKIYYLNNYRNNDNPFKHLIKMVKLNDD